MLGKEIATLVNEELKPGTNKVTFDGSNLSSGVYYYQLKVGYPQSRTEYFTETKKMILLK